MYDVKLVCVN